MKRYKDEPFDKKSATIEKLNDKGRSQATLKKKSKLKLARNAVLEFKKENPNTDSEHIDKIAVYGRQYFGYEEEGDIIIPLKLNKYGKFSDIHGNVHKFMDVVFETEEEALEYQDAPMF